MAKMSGASGWHRVHADGRGATWRGTMKSSNFQQKSARAFKPKPLTVEQETAIDALLQGKSDREAAEIAGCTRWSVQSWRNHHPLFMATLHQRRETLFSGAVDRMRSLLGKALDNVAGAIEAGDVKASFELLKATAVWGHAPPPGELDPAKILDDIVMRLLAKEKLPGSMDDLLIKLHNSSPEKDRREQEIRDELLAEYGEA
jgi:hypothetical protein